MTACSKAESLIGVMHTYNYARIETQCQKILRDYEGSKQGMNAAIRDTGKSGNGIETERLKQMNYLVWLKYRTKGRGGFRGGITLDKSLFFPGSIFKDLTD